jgi:hypothetical protein
MASRSGSFFGGKLPTTVLSRFTNCSELSVLDKLNISLRRHYKLQTTITYLTADNHTFLNQHFPKST